MSRFTAFVRSSLLSLAAVALGASSAHAQFFSLSASGGGNNVTATGGTLIDLANDLITQKNAFASLASTNFTGSLNYGGVPNAIVLSGNAAHTSATLTIPGTGFSKTFTGINRNDLETQIKNFILTDGLRQYSALVEQIDHGSTVAAVDGNPQAATAFVNTDVFYRFGLRRSVSDGVADEGNQLQFRFDGSAGTTTSEGFAGSYIDGTLDADWKIGDNFGLSLATDGQYRDVGGSTAYTVGETVGVPITLVNREGPGVSWTVTPWGFAAFVLSYDQVTGGVLAGFGGTSSLDWQIGDFTLTAADQGGYTGDVAVQIGQYRFDAPVAQWIVKNGGQIAWNPGQKMLFLDAGIAYSNFLRTAAVPNYWTGTGGIGLRFGRYSSLRVGYLTDFCNKYHSSGGQATLVLSF